MSWMCCICHWNLPKKPTAPTSYFMEGNGGVWFVVYKIHHTMYYVRSLLVEREADRFGSYVFLIEAEFEGVVGY